jgi:hypothetical protein
LDAKDSAVVLAAAVNVSLREEGLELTDAVGALGVERTHQHEEDGRALRLLGQNGQRVA